MEKAQEFNPVLRYVASPTRLSVSCRGLQGTYSLYIFIVFELCWRTQYH